MTSPKSATDLGLSAPLSYPYPLPSPSEWDKLIIRTPEGHDIALLPRFAPSRIAAPLWDKFIDRQLALEDGPTKEAVEVPKNLAKVVDSVVLKHGHPAKVTTTRLAVHNSLAEGAAVVAGVLGDLPTMPTDGQCQRIIHRLVSEDWLVPGETIAALLFGYQAESSQANSTLIDGVLLSLIAWEMVGAETSQTENTLETKGKFVAC